MGRAPSAVDRDVRAERSWRRGSSADRVVDLPASRGPGGLAADCAWLGTRIGDFTLVRLLGRGGMGEV